MKLWILTGCLFLGFLRVGHALDGSPAGSQTVLPKGSTICSIRPDAPSGPLQVHIDPRTRSGTVNLSPESKDILRVNTRSQADGDWIEIKSGGIQGWVKSALLVCRAPVEQVKEIISNRASRAIESLKQRNLRELSQLVHPVKGLRFSPDAFLNQKANVLFKATQLPGALQETRRRVWGTRDGSGNPIRLTFAEYYRRFVYDRDFASASEISYNGGRIGKSNTADNSVEDYPHAIIVEYLVSGTEPEQQGMDWASLRLIFEQHLSQWYLVYIVHDKWTI